MWPFVAGEGETIGSKAIVTKQSILLVHVTDYDYERGNAPSSQNQEKLPLTKDP